MWRQPQAMLLRDMWQAGIHAVMVKVAAIGLYPSSHIATTRSYHIRDFVRDPNNPILILML